jgi:hypothetical protein
MAAVADETRTMLEDARADFPMFYARANARDAALLDALLCVSADGGDRELLVRLCDTVRECETFRLIPAEEQTRIALATLSF